MKLTSGVIDSIIQKSDEIAQKITNLAEKSDLEEINQKLDSTVSKDDFTKITLKTEDLVNNTDEVKQTLAQVTKDIETLPNTKLLEELLQDLFHKLDSLSDDIASLNNKGDVYDIDSKIMNLKDELVTIKNIVSDLNDVITSKVISTINDISFENESYDIKNHVSKMLSLLPQKEDIDRILSDGEFSSNALNNLLDRTNKISDKIDNIPTKDDFDNLNSKLNIQDSLKEISTKSDLEGVINKTDEIEQMIDDLNFDDEFKNIYDKTSSIESWLVDSKIKENTENISKKTEELISKDDIKPILSTTEKIITILENDSTTSDVEAIFGTIRNIAAEVSELKNEISSANNIQNDEKVLVVGGGNSAVEYATLLCKDNDTTLNYRRTEFSRINDVNAQQLQDSIQSGKLKTRLGVDIQGLEDSDGKVKVNFTDNQSEVFDRVVYAIGGAAPIDFLKKCQLALDENGAPISNQMLESSIPNVFLAGDIALKSGGSIAAGLNHGYQIACEIKKRLG